jgi:DNA polymerase III subunit epsilon
MRQIVLDTETTGLEAALGHRIIEIGCVELFNRRLTGKHFHCYINPEREVDEGAFRVHGISTQMLADKPKFIDVVTDFIAFVGDADLIIHNAAFDIGFINAEFARLSPKPAYMETRSKVIDTLLLARAKHPGQKNNLDALCKRYGVDNSQRDLHGALLDAEILADVYLLMTGGQTALSLGGNQGNQDNKDSSGINEIRHLSPTRAALPIIMANSEELAAHELKLASINSSSNGSCVWLRETSLMQ